MTFQMNSVAENDFARSHRPNWTPPAPITSELEALQSLKAEWKRQSSVLPVYDGYKSTRELLYVALQDFEIYRSPDSVRREPFELTSLHIEVPLPKKLCFDGFLRVGNITHYVQAVTIQDSSVEGFGDAENPGTITYVQSKLASKDGDYDIWYKLKRPTSEYKRFHEPFRWVAQLTKHVIDYIEAQPARSVGLASFRLDFHRWLIARFSWSEKFRRWHHSFEDQVDFRLALNASINYVYQQALNLPDSKQLLGHPLWGECLAAMGLTSIKQQEELEKYTLATHDVFESFKDMYFGNMIREVDALKHVRAAQEDRKRKLGFPIVRSTSARPHSTPLCQPYGQSPIKVGDIIALDANDKDRKIWRNAAGEWLAYVQGVTLLHHGIQRLSVLWLYQPQDTNIFNAKYPFHNELFLSDNCNCSDGEILSTDIKGRYSVEWSPTTIDSTKGFFIRQTYMTQESAFVSYQKSHKTCRCKKPKMKPIDAYKSGDTVYMTKRNGSERTHLEPVIIRHINKDSGMVTVQELLRLKRDCSELAKRSHRTDIASNELVLTKETEQVKASRIQRRCSIRFVRKKHIRKGRIPFAYDRGGAGDLWFVSMRMRIASNGDEKLKFLKRLPACFHEGLDLTVTTRKLRGLSIFSGGGSLDRGLEDGGAVEFQTAVDRSKTAIHTQLANARNPSKMRLYCGSVDDFFRAALAGKNAELVPCIGEVDFIAAGSPCPGYSTLQKDPFSENSLRNSSHISTFCSYVDLYRPLYGILENVVNMASTRKGIEDQNVLSQLVACLVSMGYQVNQYIMDAWCYNSAQRRSRIILTIAAPGLSPILQPEHTSSMSANDTANRSLGKLPNGQRFGEREHYATPFSHVTAGDITSDLPNIGNGGVQSCIPYPDHRLSYLPNGKIRALLECIPKDPPGCGYKEAHERGLIPLSLQKSNREVGKGYRRVKEHDLIPTITTSISPNDSHNGACLHYSQDRAICIMDARRTQGYLDDEVVIGKPSEKYEIIGNGVDRKVSFALGLALRRAMEKNDGSRRVLVDYTETVEERPIVPDEQEDDFEGDTTGSEIHVLVPTQRDDADARSSPSVMTPPRPRSGLISPSSDEIDQTTPIALQESEGSSNVASFSNSSQPAALLLPKTGIIYRLGRRIGKKFSLLSTQSLSNPTILPVRRKRNREEHVSDDHTERAPSSGENSHLRKRAKTDNSLQSSSVAANGTGNSTGQATRHDNAKTSTKTRHTRHSGLPVEFSPKNWNKRPEMERRKNP